MVMISKNVDCVSGWQDDNMGCIHNEQRTCSNYAHNMGDGMCICTIRKFGSMWVSFMSCYKCVLISDVQ
jgi:hypothetical protein